MLRSPFRRTIAGLALGAVATSLATIPSSARAADEDNQIGGMYWISDNNSCTPSETIDDDQDIASWAANGVPVTRSGSARQTYTGAEGDQVDLATSYSTSITAPPLGSGPATITGTATANVSAQSSGDTTECDSAAEAEAIATGIFTLTKPMWVTLTAKGSGTSTGRSTGANLLGIGRADEFDGMPIGFYFGIGTDGLLVSTGTGGASSASGLLQPGDYRIAFAAMAYAQVLDDKEGTAAFTGNFKIDMQLPGAAAATRGKGASKVTFGDRDCASGAVSAAVTKKLAKKAKRIAFKVNGKKVANLKGKKLKKRIVVLPAAPNAELDVKASIKLKNGHRVKAMRTYLPCK